MGKKLYIGKLPFSATEDDLRELFANVGEVRSVKVITDAITGRSRGFGFVEMISKADANKAIDELNGSELMEKTVIVSEARPRQRRERGDLGGGRDSFGKERDYGDNRGGFGRGEGHRRGLGTGRRTG